MTNGKLNQKNTSILEINKGNEFKQQGQLAEAVNCYRQAIAIDPLAVEAYQLLATTLKQQGNTDEAAKYYRQALELRNNASAITKQQQANLPASANLLNSAFSFQTLNPQNKLKTALIEFKLESQNYLVSLALSEPDNLALNYKSKTEIVQAILQKALDASEAKNWQSAILAARQALEIEPQSAETYKILGNALQKSGQAAEAIDCYHKALAIQPDLAEVYASVGDLYSHQQKWRQAIDYYQKAIAINPKIPTIYRSLSEVWQQVGEPRKALECIYRAVQLEPEKITSEQQLALGDKLLDRGKIGEAMTYYRRAIELNPNYPHGYRKIAEIFESQEQWQQAAAFYRRALELNEFSHAEHPSRLIAGANSKTNLLPGKTAVDLSHLTTIKPVQNLLKVRNKSEQPVKQVREISLDNEQIKETIEEKIQEYLEKVQKNPHSALIQSNLGNLYAQQKDWEKAIACYQMAIQLDSNLAPTYRNLAKVLQYTGRQEAAVEYLYRAVKLDPTLGKPQEYLQLGHTFLKKGKTKRAIACYRQAVSLRPNFAEAYHCLGEALTNQGQQQEAIACYYEVIANNPQDIESQYRLAKALAANNDVAQAIDCYRTLIKNQPDRFQLHYDLADLLMKKERWYDSIRSFYRAIELNPNFPWSYYYLGTIFLRIKRWQKAAEIFTKAIELNPNFLWSYYYLAEASIELEDWDRAIDICRRALERQPDFFEASQKLNQALSQKLISRMD
jgi:tetratricopeptide (TPR) repeat protein